MGWYEKAEAQIEQDFQNGIIDHEEYKKQMRDIVNELRNCAEEAAQSAYDDHMH